LSRAETVGKLNRALAPEERQPVKVHWTEIAIATACAVAACAAAYAALVHVLRRVVAERQRATDRQLNTLETVIKTLQLRIAELDSVQATRQNETDAAAASSENMAGEENNQMKPETLAVISAAAATFLGRKARVRSAHTLPAPDAAGAWAQQGRIIVQTSHNLRPRT
jgi:FtsZ-binding cell division protein ZapB